MQTISNLMRGYFSGMEERSILSEGLPKEVPITPKKVVWKPTKDGDALIRSYEFKNASHLRKFVDGLLSMQERIEHHAQILIEDKIVKVRVGTHTLNRITELDTEYAAEADQIFDETGDLNG